MLAAPVIGGFIENLSVLSPAFDLAGKCELPLLTHAAMPLGAYSTELGFALAAAALLALAASFKFTASEVARYRALTIISSLGWTTTLLASVQVFLALFVLPIANCEMRNLTMRHNRVSIGN